MIEKTIECSKNGKTTRVEGKSKVNMNFVSQWENTKIIMEKIGNENKNRRGALSQKGIDVLWKYNTFSFSFSVFPNENIAPFMINPRGRCKKRPVYKFAVLTNSFFFLL